MTKRLNQHWLDETLQKSQERFEKQPQWLQECARAEDLQRRAEAQRLYNDSQEFEAARQSPVPAEELRYIRRHLCLNMSDLASLLGVSRPTAYAWLDGDEPEEAHYHSIVRLSRIAKQFESLHLANIGKLLRRPVFDGRSLLDKLKASEEIDDYIPALQNLASKEASARARLKGSGKSLDNQGLESLIFPLYEV